MRESVTGGPTLSPHPFVAFKDDQAINIVFRGFQGAH